MLKTSVNRADLQDERLAYYQLFLHYYRGDLNQLTIEEWKQLVQVMRAQPTISQNSVVNNALGMFEKINEDNLVTFQFDYNRLFVGPNRLLASPYESSYVNVEGSIMQNETLKVRNFYYHEGLQVAEEGTFPDDHIQFELEFMIHLLGFMDDEEKQNVERLFLQKHLFKWCPKHCEKIEQHSQNDITLAMASLLKGFLQVERLIIEGRDFYEN